MNRPGNNFTLRILCMTFVLMSVLECEYGVASELSYAWQPAFSNIEALADPGPEEFTSVSAFVSDLKTLPTAFISQPSFILGGFCDRYLQTWFVSDQLTLNQLPPDRSVIRVLRKQTNPHRSPDKSSPHSA